MKILTTILLFSISFSNLDSQILELDGTWSSLKSHRNVIQKIIVFNNDSLLISEFNGGDTDMYFGSFKIEKDTLTHFVGEHLPFIANRGRSSTPQKTSPFITKYAFRMEGGFIFLKEFFTTQKGRKRLVLKAFEKEIKKQLLRKDIRHEVRKYNKKQLESIYLSVAKKESNSTEMDMKSISLLRPSQR